VSGHHRRGPHRGPWGGGPPPWWPEGEAWPSERPPWAGSRRLRRRFLFATLTLLLGLFLLLLAAAALFGGWDGRDADRAGRFDGGHPRLGFFLLLGAGALVVFVTYRLVTRPVGALVDAAEQVKAGDFSVQVEPSGPRELRSLTTTFNAMTAELSSAEERRRLLLAEVSHELRTPLAVLHAGLEAQLDGVQPRDDQHLQSLLEEAEQLGRLIDDLHTVAVADAGQLELQLEACRPADLVSDAVAGHAALAQRRGIDLRSEVAPDLPELQVDPTRLRQVLDNLLANAVRHVPDGGSVVLAASAAEGAASPGVVFEVADDGPGFPPERLDEVFERFTRGADSRGSGIGLSLARDLVLAHGGTIEAANRPDGGAVVRVVL
jgi:signal transduction histidine kinase